MAAALPALGRIRAACTHTPGPHTDAVVMRRVLVLLAITSVATLGLTASTTAAGAAPLPLAVGGCKDTPVSLSSTATIARTCASWDGTNLAVWIEGTGLDQEFTAIGSANLELFGYVLAIEARVGVRHGPYGAWEAFAELTKPFALGPLTIPLEVAENGTRVTLWISTAATTSHSKGVGTDAVANSFTLTFAGPDGTTGGSVALPLGITAPAPPTPPSPDVQPSTHGTPAPLVSTPIGTTAARASVTTFPRGVEDAAAAASAAPRSPAQSHPRGIRVASERASLGRY